MDNADGILVDHELNNVFGELNGNDVFEDIFTGKFFFLYFWVVYGFFLLVEMNILLGYWECL